MDNFNDEYDIILIPTSEPAGIYECSDGIYLVVNHNGKNYRYERYNDQMEFPDGSIIFEGCYIKNISWELEDNDCIASYDACESYKDL
jgi:hypothetical protein